MAVWIAKEARPEHVRIVYWLNVNSLSFLPLQSVSSSSATSWDNVLWEMGYIDSRRFVTINLKDGDEGAFCPTDEMRTQCQQLKPKSDIWHEDDEKGNNKSIARGDTGILHVQWRCRSAFEYIDDRGSWCPRNRCEGPLVGYSKKTKAARSVDVYYDHWLS